MSLETDFARWFADSANLNKDRVLRKRGHNTSHVRIMSDAGIGSLDELINIFEELQLTYYPCDDYTGSPFYNGMGFNVVWRSCKVGVLLALKAAGNVRRKQLSPHNLKLAGKQFANAAELKVAIINGINGAVADEPVRECLISMLANLESRTPIIDTTSFLKINGNIVTSDFGEALAAYESALRGNAVAFPNDSNNPLSDYTENGVAVSCKGRKAGGSVNLANFVDKIDTTTDAGKFLYAIASHDREAMFEVAARVCPEVGALAEMVGGTSRIAVANFVDNYSYDKFYDVIATSPHFYGLGIPKKASAKINWKNGDTNPFYFTLNTIISRIWGESAIEEISTVVTKFLNEAKFVFVDIVNGNITVREVDFSDITRWKTAYWGNALSAFNNWIGVQPYKG